MTSDKGKDVKHAKLGSKQVTLSGKKNNTLYNLIFFKNILLTCIECLNTWQKKKNTGIFFLFKSLFL